MTRRAGISPATGVVVFVACACIPRSIDDRPTPYPAADPARTR
ncbi:Hypothetical protein I596_3172 [Dokdonella koreensis DS-123]|uniref:Lipoprotein n=1 Tax=Dokdonella koreensis DS-123 TaxID=1300342 RepID=A0A167H6G8_9GAMM|nr:Hypothetical protein I596_3172 [Dokdonella koreensis DS-123]